MSETQEPNESGGGNRPAIHVIPVGYDTLTAEPAETGTAIIDATRLRYGLESIRVFRSKDKSRPILTAVRLENQGDYINLVATDSYRLGVIPVPVKEPMAVEFPGDVFLSALIDSDSIESLYGVLKGCRKSNAGTVSLSVESSGDIRAEVTLGGKLVVLILRTIPGEFPNYKALIPDGSGSWAGLADGSAGVGLNPAYLVAVTKAMASALKGQESAGGVTVPVVVAFTDRKNPATFSIPADNDPDGQRFPDPVGILMPVKITSR